MTQTGFDFPEPDTRCLRPVVCLLGNHFAVNFILCYRTVKQHVYSIPYQRVILKPVLFNLDPTVSIF